MSIYLGRINLKNIVFFFRNKLKIQNENKVKLGKNVRIRNCQITILGDNNRLVIENGVNLKKVNIEIIGNNCSLVIGANSIVGEGCYFSVKEDDIELCIGVDCMFSRNISLLTSDGHDIYNKEGERINPAKSIYIGDHVWLCDGVTVLKGTHIGSGSVVGIKSLVTKTMPENSIIAGVPAKVVQTGINWDEKLTF